MPESRPILSLAIPTFNRAPYLAELLECLLPQFIDEPRAELIISDNASEDETEALVAAFIARGLPCRYARNSCNIGADANFLQCLDLASGKYAWVMGDDDLIAEKTISHLIALTQDQEYDLIYLSSIGFSGDARPSPKADKLGRFAEVVTDGAYFLEKVNALIGLISVNIINKDRLLSTPHPPLANLSNSNLIQVGWLFPLIRRECRILYVFERLVFYRHFNSGGWGICEVFGLRLNRIAQSYFADDPSLGVSLMDGVLRYWLPDAIVETRHGKQQSMHSENFAHALQPVFSDRWRYWVFVYLVAKPPLSIAVILHRFNRLINKLTRGTQALIRHAVSRSEVPRPRSGHDGEHLPNVRDTP